MHFAEARATEDCLIAADSEEELLRKVERVLPGVLF
jgi:hypothetical protein